MVKNFLVFSVSLLALSVPVSSSRAEEASVVDVSANVAFVSQYSFRGLAQSNENPAVQGGFDISHKSGLYAGVWGSNVNFNDGDEANLETDLYVGYSGSYKGFNYDIGGIYYAYPGADSALDYDFFEASLAVGYDFDVLTTSLSLNYSPEFFADSGDALYYAAAVDVPLPYDLSLSAHIGHQNIEDNAAYGVPNYTDWAVGLGYNFRGFDLSAQYVDTDLKEPSECADGCSERVIFSISRSF